MRFLQWLLFAPLLIYWAEKLPLASACELSSSGTVGRNLSATVLCYCLIPLTVARTRPTVSQHGPFLVSRGMDIHGKHALTLVPFVTLCTLATGSQHVGS